MLRFEKSLVQIIIQLVCQFPYVREQIQNAKFVRFEIGNHSTILVTQFNLFPAIILFQVGHIIVEPGAIVRMAEISSNNISNIASMLESKYVA